MLDIRIAGEKQREVHLHGRIWTSLQNQMTVISFTNRLMCKPGTN